MSATSDGRDDESPRRDQEEVLAHAKDFLARG
jgi:hypothetical protein